MSTTNWFRRLFTPSSPADDAEASPLPDYMAGAPGVSGFADLETAGAIEGLEEETEAPPDLAP